MLLSTRICFSLICFSCVAFDKFVSVPPKPRLPFMLSPTLMAQQEAPSCSSPKSSGTGHSHGARAHQMHS